MKKILLMFIVLLAVGKLYSQKSAFYYLSCIPKYGGSSCDVNDSDTAMLHKYQEDCSKYFESLGNDIEEWEKRQYAFMVDNEEQVKKNMIQQAGYSEEDAQRLANADEMSDEQKEQIVNSMMMEKMNMDMSDFRKLADMDSAAQKRWAQGYGTMAMAEAMANPQANQESQRILKEKFDVAQRLQYWTNKTKGGQDKYFEKFYEHEKKVEIEQERVNTQIMQLGDPNDCTTLECREAIESQRNSIHKAFCIKLTPQYEEISRDFFRYVSLSISDYDSLDVALNAQNELQTGIKNPNFKAGLSALIMVKAVAQKETAILKYYTAEEHSVGMGEEGSISN